MQGRPPVPVVATTDLKQLSDVTEFEDYEKTATEEDHLAMVRKFSTNYSKLCFFCSNRVFLKPCPW